MAQKKESKNLMTAVILSLAVLLVFDIFFPAEKKVQEEKIQQSTEAIVSETLPLADASTTQLSALQNDVSSEKIAIKSDFLKGSIRLTGAVFDDLTFLKYKKDIEKDSPDVSFLTQNDLVFFNGKSYTPDIQMPDSATVWSANQDTLTPETPVVLSWVNNQGVRFERTILLDEKYMFTIEDKIINQTEKAFNMAFGASLVRINPKLKTTASVHQGFVAFLDEDGKKSLIEENYQALKDAEKYQTKGGWFGLTDKYWLSALSFDQQISNVQVFADEDTLDGKNVYSADYLTPIITVAAGNAVENTVHFFAGPKDLDLLEGYQDIFPRFELAIDFGWYYFLTKPFLIILEWLYSLCGNMGIAILIFATLLRIALLPISAKSFVSMAKMRKIQPKLQQLQKLYKNDRMRLNQEMMMLYRKEKINPASGCLPMLIQIPVFFSLYKVLSVSIAMRQAPFFGWIQDLSAPDPTSVFTLFGLLPISLPSFLTVGVWPILMGITMYLQQKMNPAPPDKTQASVFKWMPIIFTFMMAQFSAGLVIYWTWSNILAIAQQKYIMNKYGEK